MQRSLLLTNARILTMDLKRPAAGALATIGDRIATVGTDTELPVVAGAGREVIDCGGRMLLPGLIDAHAHVLAQASALASVDCSPDVAPSIETMLARIHAQAPAIPGDGWLRARGYHEASLAERRHPTRRDLDRAVADGPLRLIHASGHASVLNSAALAALGIGIETEEPAGARIERELDTGEPSGLLIEMEDRLDQAMPHSGTKEMEALVGQLSELFLAAGVTSVQDLGHRNDKARAEFFARLVANGRFRPRLSLATGYDAFESGESAWAEGLGAGPVKITLNETNEAIDSDPAKLAGRVAAVHHAGLQVAIHASEERSISAALAAIEAAQEADPRPNSRHRIEHASITPPSLARRIADLGVAVVSNPVFLWAHGDRYLHTVAPTSLQALYDVAGLRRAGVHVAAGSDCPIAPPEPALGIAAATTRRTRGGKLVPGEAVDLTSAIALYTREAARVGGYDCERGRIATGMDADLVLWDVQDEGRAPWRPVLTILGGQIAWSARSFAV